MINMEVRVMPGTVELRTVDDDRTHIIGYAAIFEKWSEDLGWFKEKIAPGAFDKALKNSDVRALYNHNANYILGREKAGTLSLSLDDKGLRYDIIAPETDFAKRIITAIKRGDISGSSFAFWVEKDEYIKDEDDNSFRTIIEYREIFDVGPVTFPAYPDTDAQVRSLFERAERDGLFIGETAEDDSNATVAINQNTRNRKLEMRERRYRSLL